MSCRAGVFRGVVYVGVAFSILAAVVGIVIRVVPVKMGGNCPESEKFPPPPLKSGPVPGGGVATLALMGNTSCAQLMDRSVWCWGDGRVLHAGVLEKPTQIFSASPRKNMVLGGFTRCDITEENRARCTKGVGLPVGPPSDFILELPNVKHLVVGAHHACAIREREQEGLWCWGANDSKQIIDSSKAIATPTRVTFAPSGSTENVAVGDDFTCAQASGQNVECWGSNRLGQLGGGGQDLSISHATVMQTESTVQLVAGNDHACALSKDGRLRCWGANAFGQLGDGTTENRSSPVEVKGLDGPTQQIVASSNQTCAVMATGMLYCWGETLDCPWESSCWSPRYQSMPPVRIPDLNNVVDLALGEHHACALRRDGSVACWGENSYRQVSDGMPFFKDEGYGNQKYCGSYIRFLKKGATDHPVPVIW